MPHADSHATGNGFGPQEALSILIKVKELEGPPGAPPCGPEVVQQLAFLTRVPQ